MSDEENPGQGPGERPEPSDGPEQIARLAAKARHHCHDAEAQATSAAEQDSLARQHAERAEEHAAIAGRLAHTSQSHMQIAEGHATTASGHANTAQSGARLAEGQAAKADEYANAALSHAQATVNHAKKAGEHASAAEDHANKANKSASDAQSHAQTSEGYASKAGAHADAAESHADEAGERAKMARSLEADLLKLREYLLEDEVEEKDGVRRVTRPSLKGEMEGLKTQLLEAVASWQAFQEKEKENAARLRASLEEDIRSLLPDAGAAGLASGYFESKIRYGRTRDNAGESDEEAQGGRDKGPQEKFLQRLSSPQTGPYFLFLTPLLVITCFFLFLLLWESGKDAAQAVWDLFRYWPITAPLGVISVFGWRSIAHNRRLYEEYNHKQRVLHLYHAFKEEVAEQGAEGQNAELIQIMLRAVADKPSITRLSEKKKEGAYPFSSLKGKVKGTAAIAENTEEGGPSTS